MITTQALQSAWQNTLLFLPNLLAAIVIFILGWFVAIWIGKLIAGILNGIKFDALFDRTGWKEALANAELKVSPSGFIGAICKWILVIVVLMIATNILGWVAFAGHTGEHHRLGAESFGSHNHSGRSHHYCRHNREISESIRQEDGDKLGELLGSDRQMGGLHLCRLSSIGAAGNYPGHRQNIDDGIRGNIDFGSRPFIRSWRQRSCWKDDRRSEKADVRQRLISFEQGRTAIRGAFCFYLTKQP